MARPPASDRALAVARGEQPADLLLRGGRVLACGTRQWVPTDLAVADGVVCAWGTRDAAEVIDVDGAALTPGLIDAHMHLESTKLWVDQFVATVLPRGTTAVAADPHEIANVAGIPGVAALAEAARRLPFTFGICASSCVPASPFESPGASLGPEEVGVLLEDLGAIGLAEVMDFPGVVAGDPTIRAKIARAGRRRVDGHAPGLHGPQLDAYLAAGVESDHECTTLAEAEERRAKGMWVFVRQGSASQNLAALIPTVLRHGTDLVALCTDDREPTTLLELGHMNDCVRLAIRHGVPDADAFVLATANPAAYHGFTHLGHLGPGYQADVCVFDHLETVEPALVLQAGRLVARAGRLRPGAVPTLEPPDVLRGTVHLEHLPGPAELDLALAPGTTIRAIGVEPHSLSTRALLVPFDDPAVDLARLAVLERHHGTGRVGLGAVVGLGLKAGALASTVGHDAHNVMACGARGPSGPADMAVAVARLAELGGGQVAVLDGQVLAELPLPLGGLMSDRPAPAVAEAQARLERVAAESLGVRFPAPFMTLSFLGLSVIPELRLTDRGLVDVGAFALTPLVP
jgi:adenine deaminase